MVLYEVDEKIIFEEILCFFVKDRVVGLFGFFKWGEREYVVISCYLVYLFEKCFTFKFF